MHAQDASNSQDFSANFKSIHHTFDIYLAELYGIQAALLIHHFQYWISLNKRLKRNFHEGRYWSYQTLDEIAAHFPYLSRSEVFDILELLCFGKGRRSKKEEPEFNPILMKGNFNATKYDRTVWYAFVDEPRWILAQAKMHIGSDHIGASQNQDWREPTPIPDSIPDTKTHDHDMTRARAREEEKKAHAETMPRLDQGSTQEKVEFLKKIVFPDQSTISQRNMETWSRLYSLWRMKKAVSQFRRMLESGASVTNPEGLFYTIIKDPGCESTKELEANREQIYAFLDDSDDHPDWMVDGNYVVNHQLKKEFNLSMHPDNIIREIRRLSHAE